MIPILYDRTEIAFQSNGLGRLSDCITCTVTEERNGIYECQFDYPVNGVKFDLIEKGRIIACTHDEQGDIQPFEIYRKTEPINGIVTFYAHHISYRQNEIVVKPFTASSCAEAFASLKANSIGENPFSYWTDKSVTTAYANETPSTLRSVLMGEENSLLDVYGTGEYEFSRFEVRFSTRRGRDTNVSIRYGKNLVDFENDDNSENVYTAAVPFWLGDTEEGTVLVTLPELSISSGHSVDAGREIYVPMDLSGSFSEQPTVAELRSLATSRLAASNGWVPNQTMDVNFVQLWQTEEYKEVAALQRLRLCDTCGVFVPMYGISVRAKVISVTYNVLLDRYDSMTLGDKPVTYAAVIEKNFDSKVAGIVQGFQAIEIEISSVEKAAAEDATNKANTAEQNAKGYATDKANAAEANAKGYAKNYTDSSIASAKSTIEQEYEQAIEDATEQIRGGTGGYIVTTVNANGQPIELLITDNININQAVNVWRWNQGGLGHSSNGYHGPFDDVAITQDGKINASMITTGTLTANIIRAGIISDINNINSWNLETGILAIQKGSINLGNGKFIATDEGKVTAIGGGLIRDPNSKTVFDLDSGLLTIKKGSINLGNGNFIATDAGKLTAIGGGLIRDGSSKTVFNLDTGYLKSEYGEFGPYSLGASGLQFSNAINFLALRSTEIVNTSKITWSGGRTSIMGVNFQKGKFAFVGRQNESNPENYDDQFVMDLSEWAPGSGTGGMFIQLKDKFGTELAKIDNSSAAYPISFEESVRVSGNFYVQGTKSRKVKTNNYSDRLLYCYETPTPLFGDIGEATIDEDGMCYVDIDDIFSETVAEAVEYQVFLQAEGDGKCFVSEKTPRYFAIEGTPGLRVAWELKAKQKNYQNIRLEQAESKLEEYSRPTDDLLSVDSYITEQEALLYGYN